MTTNTEEASVPVFEIDQAGEYGRYILGNEREILFHLRNLQSQNSFVTVYIDDGQQFFLSKLLTVDEDRKCLFLDPPNDSEIQSLALQAEQITISTTVDRVKVQCRLPAVESSAYNGHAAFVAALPKQLLRLQRREFFRIQTPRINPLRCLLAIQQKPRPPEVLDFTLYDLSGGGLCLIGEEIHAEKFSLGALLADCRLNIPGESVISVNLRIREVSRIESANGEHQLRLGCEFVNLPGSRLTLIERYITRLERERKAKETGLY